jgi:hypothetical protein
MWYAVDKPRIPPPTMTTSHSAIAFPGGNSNANQESIKLLSEPTRLSQAPTQDEFLEIVNDFLNHTARALLHHMTAKHVLSGELWWVDKCCNCRMSGLMLRMTEC